MIAFSRADNTFVARWWVTVDRWTLGALFVLVGCGYIMVLAASPAVAERIHASREMFIVKQLVFLALSLGIIVGVSMLPPRLVRQLALLGCGLALAATAMTLLVGVETVPKGLLVPFEPRLLLVVDGRAALELLLEPWPLSLAAMSSAAA